MTDDTPMETLEFTTPKARKREDVTTPVDLAGEPLTARQPKDAALFFAQSAVADSASDADRALAMLQFMDAILEPWERHRFLERACDRNDPLTAEAVFEMMNRLLERWSPTSKVPATTPVKIDPHPDATPGGDPAHVVNDDLDLDLVCYPPKDIILLITSSAIAAGVNPGQQSWCVMLFLDAVLDPGDALVLSNRLKNHRDPLDLDSLLRIIEALMERWYPDSKRQGNRKTRRAKAAAQRKTSPRATGDE